MIGLQIKTLAHDSVGFTFLGLCAVAALIAVFYFVQLLRRPTLGATLVFTFTSLAGWLAASPFGNAGETFNICGISGSWISSIATLWFGGLVVGYAVWRLSELGHRAVR